MYAYNVEKFEYDLSFISNTNPLLGVELLEEERILNCCLLLKTELLLEEERKLNCVHTVPGRSKQTPIRS